MWYRILFVKNLDFKRRRDVLLPPKRIFWGNLLTPPTPYRGREWPSKVKSQNQKSIFKVKSQNQKSNVDLRNKKSIRKLKSRNQMSISEARKSSFEFSLLTFDFDHPPYPPPLLIRKTW